MGRAIEQDNRLDALEIDMKMLKDVVEELSNALMSTKQVHHVDLHAETKHVEPTTLEPDEEFTPPVGKRKKTKSKATVTT